MPTFRVNDAKHDQKCHKSLACSVGDDDTRPSPEELLADLAERLAPLRTVPDDILGARVMEAGGCLDEMSDGTRPGWLFDDTTDRATATQICTDCPVRHACLELELRLFGEAQLGMWGALGESGRRALHPLWLRARQNATGATAATDAGSRGER